MDRIFTVLIFSLLILAVMGVVAFVLREVILWFWRINEAVRLLERIERNTRPKDATGGGQQ